LKGQRVEGVEFALVFVTEKVLSERRKVSETLYHSSVGGALAQVG